LGFFAFFGVVGVLLPASGFGLFGDTCSSLVSGAEVLQPLYVHPSRAVKRPRGGAWVVSEWIVGSAVTGFCGGEIGRPSAYGETPPALSADPPPPAAREARSFANGVECWVSL
jgi:hypothetical protein